MKCALCLASIAASAVLTLSACGGSDGSLGPVMFSPDPTAPTIGDAQTANPTATRGAAEKAANNLPQFGSVTQSSNGGSVSGITTDAASTSFNGQDVSLTVTRQDGSTLRLDSATDTYENLTYAFSSPVPSHTGPELSGNPVLPSLGTASYAGPAAGLYAYQYGSDRSGIAQGSAEIGEYSATATFMADFNTNTISGCIGCVGRITVAGIGVSPTGETLPFENTVSARVRLGATAFGSDGDFRSRNLSVEMDGRTVTDTSGSWGGQFSNIQDAASNPRLAAGTTGADWTESDGSRGAFVGAYVGAAQ